MNANVYSVTEERNATQSILANRGIAIGDFLPE